MVSGVVAAVAVGLVVFLIIILCKCSPRKIVEGYIYDSAPPPPSNPMDRLKNAMSKNAATIDQLKTPTVESVGGCDLTKLESQLAQLNETLKGMLTETQNQAKDSIEGGETSAEEAKAEEDETLRELGIKT